MATFANGESGLSVRTKINAVLQHADGTSGELVINDAGADVDFRVESDTNANALFVDGATGNVGIGTGAPSSKLQLANAGSFGAIRSTNTTDGVQFDLLTTGSTVTLGAATTHPLVFNTSNTERMRITASGSVGIGTTSPGEKLDVVGTFRTTAIVGTIAGTFFGDTPTVAGGQGMIQIGSKDAAAVDTGGVLSFTANTTTLNNYPMAGIAGKYQTAGAGVYSGYLQFMTTNSGGSPGERMRIDSTGNVGIGATPSAWGIAYKAVQLNYGSTYSAAFNMIGMAANSHTNGTNWIYNSTGQAVSRYEQQTGAHSWYSATGGTAGGVITFTQAMTLDASGRLVIGTTATPQISAGGIGTVSSIALSASGTAVVASMPASATGGGIRSQTVTAASTSWYHLNGSSGNGSTLTTNNIFIYGNGDVQNANNSYGAISDAKLKENIADASPKLEKLMQVRVRSYNLKGDYDQHKQIGVVAQELETVFPSMIEETQDRDLDGNSLETTTKSVKYSVFVPMLIKALQEQQVMIEDLKARLDAANL